MNDEFWASEEVSSTKKIWLRAKGEMPSFRFRPTRAAQEGKRHGIPQPSQRSQQAEHLPDRYRPFEVENETTENVGDAAISGIPATVATSIAPAIFGHAHL